MKRYAMSLGAGGSRPWGAAPVTWVAAVAMAPVLASAQQPADPSSGFWSQLENSVLLYAQAAIPAGEFGDHVELGGGGGLASVFRLSGTPRVGLRIEVNASGFRNGGNGDYRGERSRGERRSLGENSMLAGGVGPQVYLAAGPFRPYLFGTMGVARFESEWEGWDDDWLEYWFEDDRYGDRHFDDDWFERWFDDDRYDREDEFDDVGFALAGGVGFAFDVYRGARPVALDLSVSYRHYGSVRLAGAGPGQDVAGMLAIMGRHRTELMNSFRERRRPNLDDSFFDSLARAPVIRTSANLVNVRFGVSVGLF